jgi:quinoprotein dehydrogenase-associated probable ABC transporter substrate-binding protein
VLRVCADPNNMPFSNSRREGFENRIAALVAADLGRTIDFTWRPQRRGFIRSTLNAGDCDLVAGLSARFDRARTTRAYYRSTYVFVSRSDRGAPVRSFDDPRLKRLRVGIQITGEDYGNPPAAQALAARHITRNVRGYTVYGDYSEADPQRRLIDAVADGDVDVAIAWGPLAGYFARREPVRLSVTPVSPQQDSPGLPFAFDIAMAVRRGDRALGDAVDEVIARRSEEIRRILGDYGVPLVAMEGGH